MYGRKYFGAARTTFVIGKDGRIAHVFEKVKAAGHDRQVLDWLKEAGLARA
jgi:peroxiredoxin Q/BCP